MEAEGMKHGKRAFWGWLGRKLRTHFMAGIIATVPIGATILILIWLFSTVDNILQPIISSVWGQPIPGLGFAITIILIYLAGVIASNVIGKRIIHYGESTLPWLPVVRQIYHSIKQILESFSITRKDGFMQVVLTEFPRKGIRMIGFVTNELHAEPGKKLLTVFIPTSPNPTSGFLQIVNEDEIIRTDISVENALKMVISVGRVAPEGISEKLVSNS